MNRSSTQSSSSSGPDLVCRIKYQNKLPDIPYDPKFINYPFDPSRFIQFNSTTLEKNYKWDIQNEQDLGVRIDLINQENRIDPDACLHPIDEQLLEDDNLAAAADLKRTEQHKIPVSWMRRNDYISTENTKFAPRNYVAAESKVGFSIKRKITEVDFYKDRDAQVAAINKTFQLANIPVEKHYSKTNVIPVAEMQIFPDYELWRHPCAQVIFDDDPAPKNHTVAIQNEAMSNALIKGLVDKNGEQFVAYFLPTEDTIKKRNRDNDNDTEYDADDEYDFKLAREYTWNIKSKVNSGYEENYYFIMKEDAVYYNELETRVRLSKRRTKLGKIANTRLSVKYRDYSKPEMKNQRLRAKDLEVIDENEEESEEESESEDNVNDERGDDNENSENSEHSENSKSSNEESSEEENQNGNDDNEEGDADVEKTSDQESHASEQVEEEDDDNEEHTNNNNNNSEQEEEAVSSAEESD